VVGIAYFPISVLSSFSLKTTTTIQFCLSTRMWLLCGSKLAIAARQVLFPFLMIITLITNINFNYVKSRRK
jgi:hypothetical protein